MFRFFYGICLILVSFTCYEKDCPTIGDCCAAFAFLMFIASFAPPEPVKNSKKRDDTDEPS